MTEYWVLIAILFLIGIFAGVLAGLFGVGGGIVLVPAFVFVFQKLGYDNPQLMQIAVATSLATIIITSARSVAAHHAKGAVSWRLLKSWAAPVAIGSIIAVFVAMDMKSKTMMVIFAVFALIIAFIMLFGVGKKQISDTMPQGLAKWAYGLMMGFFSTMMGIGGGSIAVPIQVMHGRKIHQSVATAAGFGAIIAAPSVVVFLLSQPPKENLPPFQIGYVNIAAFLIVVIATILSAPWGAKLAHRLDAARLKQFFAVFIVIVAINMLRKALWN